MSHPTKKDYTFAGFLSTRPGSKIFFKHTISIVVIENLKYDEARLIGIHLHNDYKGKYEISQVRQDYTDFFRLSIALPNSLTIPEAKSLVSTARKNAKKYLKIIQPFVTVR